MPNKTIRKLTLLFSICKVLYFLLPLFVTWLSLSLMSMYMKYYDIGVNPSANNGFLIFFVAPALLTILYITAIINLYISKRFFKSQWAGILFGSILIFMVGIGAFIIQTQYYEDYPTEKPQNMTLFLKDYVRAR